MHSSILKKFKCHPISSISKVGLFGKGMIGLGLTIGVIFCTLGQIPNQAQQEKEKTRILVLTDIENEPDDAQSMVRFLTYSNQWTVGGFNCHHLHSPTSAIGPREDPCNSGCLWSGKG